jgi:hypothetical protein
MAHHAELLTHLMNERRVLSAFLSKTVVNVTRLDMDIEEPSHLEEPVQKHRGILPAG